MARSMALGLGFVWMAHFSVLLEVWLVGAVAKRTGKAQILIR